MTFSMGRADICCDFITSIIDNFSDEFFFFDYVLFVLLLVVLFLLSLWSFLSRKK
jgi:hypothetical protein